MYKNFTGFHLVEAIHKLGLEKKLAFSSKVKKIIYSVIVIAVTLWLWNAPSTMFGIVGLTVIQQRVIAIFAFATLMWIFEIVPAWATSVGIIGLMLLFTSDSGISSMVADGMVDGKPNFIPNILSYKAIMATFADPVVMLFIGGFVLAIAATKTGLDSQMAKVLLKPFGTKPSMVLLGFILITGIFSMFVSNTATAAMMLTFLTPVFKQMNDNGKGRIALALSIPIAANIGGMATPIGTPPNAIAMKYLNDPDGLNMNMGFGQWVSFMLPLTLLLLFLGWFILMKLYPFTQKTLNLEIEGKMKKDRKTYIVIVTFFVTVLLWMFDKFTGINSYTVAMIPLIVFALTGVIDRRDLEEINWSVIWMVAGGFALGYGLNASGLAENAVNSIPFGSWSPIVIMLISGLVCYLLSNFISNSATAALLMPILAVVCGAMGDKLGAIGGTPSILIGVAIAASGAMILPISTPPNALAFSTDLVKQNDMAKMGIIMGILTMAIGYTVLYFIGRAGII